MRPVCLVIAGVDPSGGAGIAADLATCAAHGVWGAPVVTAITVQDTERLHAVEVVEADLVRRQIDAVVADLRPSTVKIGMLGSGAVVAAVAAGLPSGATVVVDPVLTASVGGALLDDDAIGVLLADLVPRTTVLTPNTMEAERLTGIAVTSARAAEAAGRALLDLGAAAVLVKGGHLDVGDGRSADCLVTHDGVRWFDGPRLAGAATHGTGCVLASAVAARLALGRTLDEAVEGAKAFLARSMVAGAPLGRGPGAVDPWRAGIEAEPC